MNEKGHERRHARSNFRRCLGNCLDGREKPSKSSVRITGLQTEIWSPYLRNIKRNASPPPWRSIQNTEEKKSSYYNEAFQKQYGKCESNSKLREIWRRQQHRLLYELTANRKIDVRFHMSLTFATRHQRKPYKAESSSPFRHFIASFSKPVHRFSGNSLSSGCKREQDAHKCLNEKVESRYYCMKWESAEFLLKGRRNLIPYRPMAFSGSLFAKPGDFFLLSYNSHLDPHRKKFLWLLWLR
jgi:hypothetical protein